MKERKPFAKTKEERIRRAIDLHGDQFDYSNWDVTDSRTPKWCTCNKHKVSWKISYDNHVNKGRGCPLCRGEKIAEAKSTPFEICYNKCKDHNPDCDLLEDSFNGFCKPAKFFCKHHGEFVKTPQVFCANKHGGCPQCTEEKGIIKSRQLTRQECLDRLTHLPHIDFSESVFGSMSDYVTFYCTVHNKYHSARMYNLKKAFGCDECGKESSRSKQLGWLNFTTIEQYKKKYKNQTNNLYLFRLKEEGEFVYKVGLARGLTTRKNKLEFDFGEVEKILVIPTTTYVAFYSEQFIHRLFLDNKYTPDEITLPNGDRKRGYSEIFTLSDDELEKVMLLMELAVDTDWKGGRKQLEFLLEVNGGRMY